jgi:hypothetical protein
MHRQRHCARLRWRSQRPLDRHAWSLYAWSGSPGVDAVVTALMLAASRRSVSASSHDRTDPSATRSVGGCARSGFIAETGETPAFRTWRDY